MCSRFASRTGQSGWFMTQENGCGGLELTAAAFIYPMEGCVYAVRLQSHFNEG